MFQIKKEMDNQKMLQAMFQEATIGILVVNSEGEIVQANPFTEKLFGYERGELISNPIEILIPNSFRKGHVKHRQKYHKKPLPRTMGANLDLYGQRKDGSQFSVEISLSHMDLDGERFAIAYVNDDTLQQETLKSLKKAKKISDDISEIVAIKLTLIILSREARRQVLSGYFYVNTNCGIRGIVTIKLKLKKFAWSAKTNFHLNTFK